MSEEAPLAGLTVLDISSFIAGPAAAATLADFGADVIKIEPPDGDPHRQNFRSVGYPQSAVNFPWQLDGRLKRSVTLDLKTDAGRGALDRLLDRADVAIVNFPIAVRERLRLRWEDLEPRHPRLVYCSLTGFGETGPERDRPGFDITAYFGRAGILDAARHEGGPPGVSLPAQGDRATAMTLVAAILMGLRRRDRTGRGGWVGTSLYANGAWANGTTLQGALVGAALPPRQPPDRPRNALANLYRTADDRWLQLLLVRDDRRWAAFCAAIERPDLENEPRFASREGRRANAIALGAELAALFRREPYDIWAARLGAAGLPFGVIGRVAEVVEDPQAEHAGLFTPTDNPEVPRVVNNPIRLGFATARRPGPPPALGEHTESVLGEAGFTAAEINGLRKAGALG